MRYSVYNYGTKSYDYYDGPSDGATHAGTPPLISFGGIGAAPDAAAWKLPIGVVKAGSGELPQGRVASLGGVSSGDGLRLGMIALSAYLAWRYLR